MRLGPAPVCLLYHHPAHVAGRLAFMDHLSHGRLNVCFGPGAIPTDLEVFEVDPKDSAARVGEAIDMILKIWTTDAPYDIPGRFHSIRMSKHLDPDMGLVGLQKPFQKPFPPISIPSVSRASAGIQKAGAQGFSLFSHHMISPEMIADQWKSYEIGAQLAGRVADRQTWKISRNIFVAETTAEAQKMARSNSLGKCMEYILELTRRGPGVGLWKPDSSMSDSEMNLDYFMKDVIIAGDPEEVTRKLLDLRDRIGQFGTLVQVAHDWDDKAAWIRSHELLTKEVLPKFNQALAG